MRRLVATHHPERPTDEGLERCLAHPEQAFWLDIESPADDDFRLLEHTFHFHPLTLEDIRHLNQRPKLEDYEGYSFAVLFAVDWREEALTMREIHLYVGERYLVSVHLEPSPELKELFQRIEAAPELTRKGAPFLFYLVVDKLVDSMFPVIEQLDDEADRLEDALVDAQDKTILARIYSLKRAVVDLRKVEGAQRDMFQRLTTRSAGQPSPEMMIYYRDVYDHLVRQYETLDSLRDLLSSAMDVYLSSVSNSLNISVRRLTALAALFLPITFVTGFFGMNFAWLVKHIESPVAFWLAVLLMVLVLLFQYTYFRRKDWI
jgi:magnesium transporter